MKIGLAATNSLYSVPGVGGQLAESCSKTWALGLRTIKLYATPDYAENYPGDALGSPESLTELLATGPFSDALALGWDTVFLTSMTFANGTTNWWRADISNSKLAAEYNEIRLLTEYLLATYDGTGRTFVLQNWEGDWALMDSTTVTTPVAPETVDRCVAYFAARQRAVEDARAAVSSDVRVLHAIECNRILDAYSNSRTRLINSISPRFRPDAVSWSAYDGTIVDQGGWLASTDAWRAATIPVIRMAIERIKAAWPGVPWYVGEFGFPENEAPEGHDVAEMLRTCLLEFKAGGAIAALYWQLFDNEEGGGGPGTYRGYWAVKPDGSISDSGALIIDEAT